MSTMAILTPSYGPDFAGFQRLHESVRRHADPAVMHHVVVPRRDARKYQGIGSDRLLVWTYPDVLPSGLVATDLLATATKTYPGLPWSFNCAAVNRRRSWKPVRGWVLQQIVKMCLVDQVEADLFVNIDSDVVLVRHLGPEDFVRDGIVRLYTNEDAIRSDMRYYRWAENAHRLLGLGWSGQDRYPDHIAGLVSWDTRLLRACLDRVASVAGTHWALVVAGKLQFSEDILYGTYVRAVGTAADLRFERDTTLCQSHWKSEALAPEQVDRFVAGVRDEDRAVHIQSNTKTDEEVFRAVLAWLGELSSR